jgi:hypothetical protein
MMALHTEVFLAAELQLPFEVCAMGVMARHAGGHLLISGIPYILTDRMTELPLVRMAPQAD